MTRNQVIAQARIWIGTPWRHQGRSERGLDCIGLLVKVAEAFDLSVDDRTDYGRDPSDQTMLAHLRRHLTFVRPDQDKLGTVGVFREARLPCHVGIICQFCGQTRVIHACAARHFVVEEPIDLSRLVELGAFPGLTD